MDQNPALMVEPYSETVAVTAGEIASGVGAGAAATGLAIGGAVIAVEEAGRRSIRAWRCQRGLDACNRQTQLQARWCAFSYSPNARLPQSSKYACWAEHLLKFQVMCEGAYAICMNTWFGSFPQPPLDCHACPCLND
jgi:choline dehydrogenase-like flavoprotein